jgi:hypothetical protein
MVVCHDVDVESIGTMAVLPEDMSPLQLGTEGVYQGIRFSLVGRMKIGWDAGSWNEWFFVSEDNRKGWLAEAQGTFAVSFEEETFEPEVDDFANTALLNPAKIEIDTVLSLPEVDYALMDIKDATCLGSEGELPFPAPKGRQTVTYDFLSPAGRFACLEIDGEKKRFFTGMYVSWDELKLTYIRELEGW